MNQQNKGSLKIFFSYAESIGKTQAMLKAAEISRNQGVDVVVGHIAAHTSEQISALSAQLEWLDPDSDTFDIDLALTRKPELLLLDELILLLISYFLFHQYHDQLQQFFELLELVSLDLYLL